MEVYRGGAEVDEDVVAGEGGGEFKEGGDVSMSQPWKHENAKLGRLRHALVFQELLLPKGKFLQD